MEWLGITTKYGEPPVVTLCSTVFNIHDDLAKLLSIGIE
jgi:hypothetical protein